MSTTHDEALGPEGQRLVLEHTALATKAARRFVARYGSMLGFDTMEQLARLGLAEAARRFRPELGYAFGPFAWKYACGRLLQGARDEAKFRKRQRELIEACLQTKARESDPLATDDTASRAELFHHAQQAATAALLVLAGPLSELDGTAVEDAERTRRGDRVRRALARLDSAHRRIIEARYFEGAELKDIGEELGISYATVRRWHVAALDELRLRLAATGPDGAPESA
jgi:RNA polymerase sigma factor (sigma-70 family)